MADRVIVVLLYTLAPGVAVIAVAAGVEQLVTWVHWEDAIKGMHNTNRNTISLPGLGCIFNRF